MPTQSHRAIVLLYDATGNVVHGHCRETDPGAEPPSKEALEKEALEHARRHAKKGVDLSKASVLHVKAAMLRMDRKYRVDVALKKLVEKTP
jgi:hypothetical protein